MAQYTYDGDGNPDPAKFVSGAAGGGSVSFWRSTAQAWDSLSLGTEAYSYDPATGNFANKAGMTLQYNQAAHKHAVSSAGGNTYQYDANGNQTTRVIGADTFNLLYDAENRLVEVKKNNISIATFVYDGDRNPHSIRSYHHQLPL